jgi:hypothetical protein
MSIEAKRRGRPPKARAESVEEIAEDVVEDEVVEEDAPDEAVPVVVANGTKCKFCGRPMMRSTKLLKRYELVAVRCSRCRTLGIEHDDYGPFDENSAIVGSPPPIVVRARTLYAERHAVAPPPPLQHDPVYAALTSDWDDGRWTEIEM